MNTSRLLLLLLAGTAVAAWYNWQQGGLWGQTASDVPAVVVPSAPPPGAGPAGTPVVNPLHDLTPDVVAEIAARPLFNATRAPRAAPPPVVEPPPAPPPPPPAAPEFNPADYQLLAVAGGASGRVAILHFVPENRIYHLRKGQYLADWLVAEIDARAVTLQHNDKTLAIAMFKTTGGQATGGQATGALPGDVAPVDTVDQPPDPATDGAPVDPAMPDEALPDPGADPSGSDANP